MAITITPDEATGLTDITRPNFTMNQTVTASTDDPLNETITNVTASVAGNQPDLVITPSSSSVSITGTLTDPFVDEFTYVEPGESDKTQTPTVVQRIPNMPADKILYNLNQDNTTPYIETFTITVTADTGTTTFTLELKINNEYEGIRSFISNYYT
tara:strand:+ start:73 stop:540 length:468 start_codon:yes stop_codon:yes gene_type:complete